MSRSIEVTMTATEISHNAMQLATSRLAPAEEIEGRLTRWRLVHEEMTDTLVQAAKAIDDLLDERLLLLQQIEELKNGGCPVGPVRRFLKSLWTR